MVRTQIQFGGPTYDKLKEKSKETGKSISELVRRSLELTLEAQERDKQWIRAMGSMGKFASGLKDLSEKHDDYQGERW